MYCGNCGVELLTEDHYCRGCGKKISKTIEPPSVSSASREIDSAPSKPDNIPCMSQNHDHDAAPQLSLDSFAFAEAAAPATYLDAEREFKEEQKGVERTIGSLRLKYDAQDKIKLGGFLYLFSVLVFVPPFFALADITSLNNLAQVAPVLLLNKDLMISTALPKYLLFPASICIAYFYYKRDKRFPIWFIGSWATLLATNAYSIVVMHRYGLPDYLSQELVENWLGGFIIIGLCSIYLLCSKRVKYTFVN